MDSLLERDAVEPEEATTGAEILVVEDEPNLCELITDILGAMGHRPTAVHSVAEGRAHLLVRAPDLLLFDVKLPDGDGLELLREVRERGVSVPAIIITAFGTVERAVAAMRAGASDFLVKPFDNDRFRAAVAAALASADDLVEVELRAGEIQDETEITRELVGSSGGLKDVVALLRRVAALDATVLINGESGTGKELVARAVHSASPRMDGPFVSIDCSAMPATLIESELFGFERGAFTGAHAQRKGRVEAAHGGTLFLDEIGDMPLEAQSRLLRVLQEREITRIGGREPISVDVRIIAATHRDLAALSKEEKFRHDLLYRLNVVPIRLPPLRERAEDIPGLVDHFLAKHAARHGLDRPLLSSETLQTIKSYSWPGNVRELQNFIERAVVFGTFDLESLREKSPTRRAETMSSPASSPEVGSMPPPGTTSGVEVKTLRQAVAEAERMAVVAALRHAGGNKAQAARLLGVSYKTLFNKIHEHDIKEAVKIE